MPKMRNLALASPDLTTLVVLRATDLVGALADEDALFSLCADR